MGLYYGIILRDNITEFGMPGTSREPPGIHWDLGGPLGTTLGPPGSPLGPPRDVPQTSGTPLGPLGTSLRPLGTPLGPPGTSKDPLWTSYGSQK